ncbi:hypothetical protein RJ640_003227 [Escallonia rubra]|uniref:Deoxyuridine 5'-triphosphate nucleotidohydrolase n=1 Tax=Escallonia rubra TaxID=112253 RepID=A0AA88R3I5_9ASTE|nr:hypothetical protein RJ640_003227 [Escallonia rubra]
MIDPTTAISEGLGSPMIDPTTAISEGLGMIPGDRRVNRTTMMNNGFGMIPGNPGMLGHGRLWVLDQNFEAMAADQISVVSPVLTGVDFELVVVGETTSGGHGGPVVWVRTGGVRSGLASKHGIDVGAGVIDADYRGPVGVILFNHLDADFEVKVGDRIAQLIIQKIVTPEVTEVDDLDSTVRGINGFGSTGV